MPAIPTHKPSIPPNLEFFVDDLESDWDFAHPFDFVYGRMLTGSIRDWPKLIGQAYTYASPPPPLFPFPYNTHPPALFPDTHPLDTTPTLLT
jgi:hypothetical protein